MGAIDINGTHYILEITTLLPQKSPLPHYTKQAQKSTAPAPRLHHCQSLPLENVNDVVLFSKDSLSMACPCNKSRTVFAASSIAASFAFSAELMIFWFVVVIVVIVTAFVDLSPGLGDKCRLPVIIGDICSDCCIVHRLPRHTPFTTQYRQLLHHTAPPAAAPHSTASCLTTQHRQLLHHTAPSAASPHSTASCFTTQHRQLLHHTALPAASPHSTTSCFTTQHRQLFHHTAPPAVSPHSTASCCTTQHRQLLHHTAPPAVSPHSTASCCTTQHRQLLHHTAPPASPCTGSAIVTANCSRQ